MIAEKFPSTDDNITAALAALPPILESLRALR